MADNSIFNDNTYKFKNGVKDSCISFSLSGGGESDLFEGLVAQQLQFGVQRQPAIIYEIGSTNYYVVASRPVGQGTLTNMFGPSTAALNAIRNLADICKPTEFKITLKNCDCNSGSRGSSASKTLTFTGGFMTSLSITATAQDPTAQGSWGFVFQDVLVS